MSRIVVVPTCRPESIQAWLRAWAPVADFRHVYLVVDGPDYLTIDTCGFELRQFCWQDHVRHLGPDAWLISRQDSGCRSFGFLLAWRECADWIGTLDDDTLPCDVPWFQGHVDAMQGATKWFRTVEEVRPRGLPYFNQGKLDVRINHGLWNSVPDLDSVHGLANPRSDFVAPTGTRIVPHQQQWPMCGMNLAFHRSAVPLMLFAPMGPKEAFRRFDDIWAGLVAQRCCRALGWSISTGQPRVEHRRASDPMKNLVAEAPGIAFNERMWEIVDSVSVEESTPQAAIRSVGEAFASDQSLYLSGYGASLLRWAELTAEPASIEEAA